MEKLNAEQLKSLKWGDKVYRWLGGDFRGLRYVGRMPGSDQYLIFCDGEYLTHLYIGRDGAFSYDWYTGEYDSQFVGNLKLEKLRKEEESIRKIYFKD